MTDNEAMCTAYEIAAVAVRKAMETDLVQEVSEEPQDVMNVWRHCEAIEKMLLRASTRRTP